MSTVDTFSTACEMLGALRRREISAVELLALHLAQIERRNAALNAIVIPDFEAARRAAEAADRRRGHGEDAPLLGLPYTVKDWIEVAGLRSTAGDPNMAHYRATADSRVVSRLRAAGAVLLGKTNMAPWGDDFVTDNPVFGRTVNPWNPDYTPGGSTGGGAAAVAAGLTPLEIGNDIGGSVRIPPAFCGAYGHKPSETALPRTGQTPDPSGLHLPNPASGLAVIGPLARSADDLELALDVASGPDQGEDIAWRLAIPPARAGRLADFRVAVLAPMRWLPMDSEIVAAGDRLAAGLARLGARVERVEDGAFGNTRDLYKLWGRLAIVLMTPWDLPLERRREIAEWGRRMGEERDDEFMQSSAAAFEATAQDYLAWFSERERFRAAYRAFFGEWDVLLTPVAFSVAFCHDAAPRGVDRDDLTLTVDGKSVPYMRLAVYPALATACGQPATAFPFGLTRGGLPIGLQAIGPYLEDRTPLRFAALVAREFGGYQRPPE